MFDTTHSTARSHGPVARDDRGVSPVVGAVLMLALGVLLISVLQTAAIPALNAQHEFRHSEGVRADMVTVEATVDRVAAQDLGETALVDVGFRYPPRLLFVNPPPVAGTLRSTEPETVTIENARATGETRDYWDGTPRTVETRTLVYDPAYNEYDQGQTTVFEPWAVFGSIDGRTLARTETDLVDGRRVSLVALDGRYSRSRPDSVGLSVAPTSSPVRPVTVTNTSDPITITVPTRMRADTWRELLADELDTDGTDDDRYVAGFSCRREPPEPCGELTITLEPGTYEVRLGEVGLGGRGSVEDAVYLTDAAGNASAVPEAGRRRLAVEARDRFDNPVGGVSVTAQVIGGPGTVRPATEVTDSAGRAAFVYRAPDSVTGTQDATVRVRFGDGDAQRTVEFGLQVLDTGGAGGDGGGDTGGGGGTATSAEAVTTVGSPSSSNTAGSNRGREVTFSLDAARSVEITSFSVLTKNALDGDSFDDSGSTFDGGALPARVDGQFEVVLRDIDRAGGFRATQFVDPDSPDADVVVTLEFADGSSTRIGIG